LTVLGHTCVAAVIETTNDGTLEQHKFIIRPYKFHENEKSFLDKGISTSAINTIRFPLGQIT
jgi:hypothetical protein